MLDLGSGTGSNLRWLAPRLGGAQAWTLVDHDAALLARAVATGVERVPGVASVARVRGDLAREGLAAVASAQLVTASALLDLVSEAWLHRLADACRDAGSAALLALSWDGMIGWTAPARARADPDGAFVRDAVCAHQGRDKGTGPALGPAAGAAAERAFAARGMRTWVRPSPWELDAADAALAVALVDGWADAAAAQVPDGAARARGWAERRRADVRAGRFGLVVGHVDLLALPAETG